ncbi:replication initiation protein (plasmid) [Vagococcus sp. JNUCC 83]
MSDKTLKVNYKNELNMVPMKDFNSKEMDLFFSICAKIKNQDLQNIRFYFEDLKEMSDYQFTGNTRFINDLENVYKKMLGLTYRTEDIDDNGDEIIRHFILFNEFQINKTQQFVDISVNPKLEHVLNNLTTNYSKFELSAFTQIKSRYTKTLFRLLMQFKSTGLYVVSFDEFKNILDIPQSYRTDQINSRILNPALDELQTYFKDLKLEKIKARKGNKIEKLKFTFNGLQSDLPKVPLHNWLQQ